MISQNPATTVMNLAIVDIQSICIQARSRYVSETSKANRLTIAMRWR